MKPIRLCIAVLVAAFALSAGAAPDNAVVKMSNGVLATTTGMTVYTFDKDVANSGKSACSGACLTAWPPVKPGDALVAEPYSVITREDGTKQLAYKGKPLHTYASDNKPGDRKGDKFKDVWHVVAD